MSDPEAVYDGQDIGPEEQEDDQRRRRRWWGLLAVIVLLLLLMCCIVTTAQVWVSGGPEQARFVARNVECLQCHTELIPDFNKPAVHNPFALKECTACHTPHGKKIEVTVTEGPAQAWRRFRTGIQWLPLRWWFSLYETPAVSVGDAAEGGGGTSTAGGDEVKGPDSMLVMPEQSLCFFCHGSMGAKLSEAYPHQPFMTGRCTNCHDPHASDYGSLLAMAPDEICFTCHPMGEQLSRDQAHEPAKDGWCIDCHDPHASDFKGILVTNQRALCFRCHPDIATMGGLPVQHQPFLNDQCTGCHQPHGSDHEPLLNAESPKLCYNCHPSIEDQFAWPSAHPVGVKMTCSSCHDPHAAQYSALLTAKDNQFCYQCHNQIRAVYEGSLHNRSLCVGCHTPHGSKWEPILRDSNPELCFRCHVTDDYDESNEAVYRNKHPVRPVRFDVNANKPLTCTSSCHNPHGSPYPGMFRYYSWPRDGNCVICHKVTEGNMVGVDY